MSGADPETQLVDLQSRLAYQEHALEQLDAVVRDQERRIAGLVAALERLSHRLDGAFEDPSPGGHEVPPHY